MIIETSLAPYSLFFRIIKEFYTLFCKSTGCKNSFWRTKFISSPFGFDCQTTFSCFVACGVRKNYFRPIINLFLVVLVVYQDKTSHFIVEKSLKLKKCVVLACNSTIILLFGFFHVIVGLRGKIVISNVSILHINNLSIETQYIKGMKTSTIFSKLFTTPKLLSGYHLRSRNKAF